MKKKILGGLIVALILLAVMVVIINYINNTAKKAELSQMTEEFIKIYHESVVIPEDVLLGNRTLDEYEQEISDKLSEYYSANNPNVDKEVELTKEMLEEQYNGIATIIEKEEVVFDENAKVRISGKTAETEMEITIIEKKKDEYERNLKSQFIISWVKENGLWKVERVQYKPV